ncbi:hypothetical protein M409DRAFT_25043 [Zasmidium cellare ATCC 36951]|uniref:HORMA domain-containing protein n=1 Tax=Zasmidium cellare ATCC 36951 TaxID=1080233 RepID=A0A6A6CG57_ZASCE|nr:uncharacterized protein M409DRAFT_25043 [Zasmidium cellare ATCC 36951]KAF2164649.1 hypothetical protein M409DRAFT_25043 [Zasmidium cellare ATCC 36951]
MKTAVTQTQSLETVQTLIHGGLNYVLYLRYLLTRDVFDFRYYTAGSVKPYKDFANGKLPKTGDKHTDAQVPILLRNKSRRSDLFLDWLDNGVFPLLRNRQLHSLQVNVHGDQDDRDKVVETYNFTIRYEKDGSGVRSPAGVDIIGSDVKLAASGHVNQDLREILRAMSKTCTSLPYLPANRFVSTDLVCNSDDEINVLGFDPSHSNKLLFAHADGWSKQTVSKTLDAMFHSTDVKITHLALSDPRSSSQTDEEVVIPDELDYPTAESRTEELGLSAAQRELIVIEDSQAKESSPKQRTSSVTLGREDGGKAPLRASKRQMATPFQTSQLAPELTTRNGGSRSSAADLEALSLPPRPPLQDSLDTQSSHVPRMKKALQGMIAAEPLTQGDTQTQAMFHNAVPSPSQTGKNATPATASGLDDLDLRASVAPYQTPIPSQLNKTKKRRSEEHDVADGSPTRATSNAPGVKRLRVLRSQKMFNANGLPSSSPAPQYQF